MEPLNDITVGMATAVVATDFTPGTPVDAGFTVADSTPLFATSLTSQSITTAANPGPVGSAGSLLLVAGLAHASSPILGNTSTGDDTVAGRAIDTAKITALTASIDGGTAVSELGAINANGGFTLTPAMIAALAGCTLANGAHEVVITATDASNNTTSAGVGFTLDAVAPSLTAGLMTITGTTTLAQNLRAIGNDMPTAPAPTPRKSSAFTARWMASRITRT